MVTGKLRRQPAYAISEISELRRFADPTEDFGENPSDPQLPLLA
jgi:hypothetical protein